ncbi:MAG: 23S rRNA pseudouridine(955/2504/2580) synthase RluC [Gammaproteobacteria bacterium]|nr:MAG: 23S rRNA pseudouridine(955/2504/2580) synthase RluC [Gammaproteobacteria bacterium]
MSSAADKQVTSQVRLIEVTREEAGQRIDNFLSRHLKGVPRSKIYRILRRGEVRVNSGRIPPSYKIKAGDRVRIPPVRVATEQPATVAGNWLADIEARVVFENPRLLVIDKPSGIAVHGGSGISHGIIEVLRARRPDAPYLELVHRLDRDTSGCLIIAKRRSTLRALHAQLRDGQMTKRYLALVRGRWTDGRRRVTEALKKNRLQGGERVVRIEADGKPAETVFRPVSVYDVASLVEVDLHTGRTHQIRVHAAHIDYPLAGDSRYGDAEFNRTMKTLGLRRLFLHAHLIEFTDPAGGEVLTVSTPLDDELKRVLDKLERKIDE